MSEPNTSPLSSNAALIAVKFLIALFILYPVAHYFLFTRDANEMHKQADLNETIPDVEIDDENPTNATTDEKTVVKRIRPPQPTCDVSYLKVILLGICTDLYLENSRCTSDDFGNLEKHKIPKFLRNNSKDKNEPRATIVGFFAAGLLISSLGAALFELYKAKSAPRTSTKAKAPLSRKCSLADLTVLKHSRKELVRKESILEIPENGTLKQLGFRPKPLHRRCSFPVGPIAPIDYSTEFSGYLSASRRSSMIDSSRNILQGSRQSFLEGTSRRNSIDTRYFSLNSNEGSPERRHWSHLVHRH